MFAWVGAALFVASLLYFVYSYMLVWAALPPQGGGYASLPPEAGNHVRVVWNVVLFSLFALHHSVFARDAVRARVARLFTPARERAFYVWIASLLFLAVCALWQPVDGIAWQFPDAARPLLWALQALAIWLTLRSAVIIDVWVLSGVKPALPSTGFQPVGPYGWVRHPIYTGWFLLVFAVGTMTMTRLVFAVVSCAYLLAAIPFEERSLRASRNGAYERYSQQVRWKLFPGIY